MLIVWILAILKITIIQDRLVIRTSYVEKVHAALKPYVFFNRYLFASTGLAIEKVTAM